MPGFDGLPVVVDGVTDAPEAGIGATHGEALVKALHVVVAGEGLHGADEAGQLAVIQVKERVGLGTDNAFEDKQAVFIGPASVASGTGSPLSRSQFCIRSISSRCPTTMRSHSRCSSALAPCVGAHCAISTAGA